jgi:3D (Asp-Asp-Asp) domain-containing protein
MKLRLKYWKPIAIGIGLFCLLIFSRCHLVSLPMRKADAQLEMKLTGYCACKKCCGWKTSWYGMPVYAAGPLKGKLKTIGQTASGRIARPGTVAVDPKVFPMGTKFYIPGYGYGIARDTGGNIKGRHLDLYFWLHSSGTKWGVQHKNVKVWYPR